MLRQIMVVITPLGLAQIYKQGVRSVFIMTGINKHNTNTNSNSSNDNNKNNNNKKWNATHEREKFYHKVM
jgi:hypothetical protein